MPGSPSENETPAGVRLVAVGDLLLVADPVSHVPNRDPAQAFERLPDLFAGCDVVLANLECTVPADCEPVPTEPRVVATPEMVRAIRPAGFNVVTLANNHTFDYYEGGFHRVRELLGEMGIASFGAGDDLEEASAPVFLEVRGVRIAFLGAADQRSGVSRFAGPGAYGVAPLDGDRMAEQVRALRRQVDHVVVSLHWGEERLRIPAPDQVALARALAEAGATLVLGHHPHVVQGLETHAGVPIVYSLGNFLASEVLYASGDKVTWNRTERTGCILYADLTADGAANVRQAPCYDSGVRVERDGSGFGDRLIARMNRMLARGVTLGRYRRERFRVKTLRPILNHLRWSSLKTLRPGKVWKFLQGIAGASRAE